MKDKYLKFNNMKKSILSLFIICLTLLLKGQTSAIDDMFNKYQDKEGFTVVSISSKMFSMFADKDEKDKNANDIVNHLKSIKILSVEDSLLNKNLNFYSELSKRLNMSDYEELMVVKDGPDITKFLIRQKGDVISELLVVTGGPGGNSLISIKGDLNLKSISDLSKAVDIQALKDLDNLEKEKKNQK